LNDDKAVNAGSAASLLSMSTPVLARLSQEASIMAQLSHPHSIAMIGVTTVPAAVVQEYAARGSLLDVLRAAKTDPTAAAELTWARRISICIGTAKGMAYLHGRQPQPVIHRDLKSANVLLTQDWTPKVADFGLSKVMTDSARSATRAAMNPRWLSPEILQGRAAAPPADVFAFGVVLWELLSWELPWGTTGPWVIVGALGAGERPPIPPRSELPGPPGTAEWEGLDGYLALMQRCWAQEPEDRPSFEAIINELEGMAPPLPPSADSPPQTPLSPSSTASGRSSRSRRPSSASSDPFGRPVWR
jgi:serine/threonine protein kinase